MSAAPRTRADAVRNYERVLAAAAEVLAEKGAEAGVPEIAARAGVGKGTVYRCFPTKEHLVSAVARASGCAGSPTRARGGGRAPRRVGRRSPTCWCDSAERQAGDCTFSAGLAHESALPEIAAAREAMYAAIDALMARAQAEGRMRAGVDSRDVQACCSPASAQMLRADGQPRPGRLAALRGARRGRPARLSGLWENRPS